MQSISWALLLWLFREYVLCLAWQPRAAGRLSWHRLMAGDSGTSSARLQAAPAMAGHCHTCHPSPSWQRWVARGACSPALLACGMCLPICGGFSLSKGLQSRDQCCTLNGRGELGEKEAPGGHASSVRGLWRPVSSRIKQPKSSEGRPCGFPGLV